MRLIRAVVAVAVLGASLFWTAGAAHACSCAMPNVSEGVASSDAAFVATFEGRTGNERGGGDFGGEVGYGFAVEEWIKGDGPAKIEVWSSADGSSCGLEVRPGQRVGIFAQRRGGELHSGLCSTIGADMLLAAVSPVVVVGEGPAHFVVSGDFPEGPIAYLDSAGRPLGYLGEPTSGGWGRLESCPGGSTVVYQYGDNNIEVVDLATGDRRPIELGLDDETGYVFDLTCLAPDGDDVAVLIERFTSRSSYSVGRIDPEPRNVGVLPAIRGGQPMLVGEKVVVAESNEAGGRVRLFDPATGSSSTVAEIDRDGSGDDFAGYDQPAPSPDGTRVAIVESIYRGDGDTSNTVLVIDVLTGEVGRSASSDGERWGITWLDDDHLGAPTSFDGETTAGLAVLDATSLEEVAMLDRFSAFGGIKIDEEIWGVDGAQIQRASLAGDSVDIVHTFAAALSGELIALTDPIEPPAGLTPPSVGGAVEAESPTTLPPFEGDAEGQGDGDGEQAAGGDDTLSGGSGSGMSLWLWGGAGALAGAACVAGWMFSRTRKAQ